MDADLRAGTADAGGSRSQLHSLVGAGNGLVLAVGGDLLGVLPVLGNLQGALRRTGKNHIAGYIPLLESQVVDALVVGLGRGCLVDSFFAHNKHHADRCAACTKGRGADKRPPFL